VNHWSIGGRTRHIGIRPNFLRELKENGIIKVKSITSEDNVADILTKSNWSIGGRTIFENLKKAEFEMRGYSAGDNYLEAGRGE
jgi:hypothetical protein